MGFRNKSEFFFFRLLVRALQSGPPRAVRNLLETLGSVLGTIFRYRRSVVLEQLGHSFPNLGSSQLEDLADGVYRHLGRTAGEAFGSGFDDLVDGVLVVPGWQQLDEVMAEGKGAIVVTGHIGNFELGGAVLARRYSLLDVVKPQRNVLFDAFINNLRHQRGIMTVPVDESGPAVARHLRRGGLVSLLVDQDAGQQGVFVNFLGRPASTWPGAARLSLRTGCPIVPVAILRQKDNAHCLFIGTPMSPAGRPNTPQGIKDFLQDISNSLEEYIYGQPEQWFWVHRRWKSQAKGPEEMGAEVGQEN